MTEVKEFVEQGGNVVVLGLFKNQESDAAKQFISVASSIDESPFGISSDPEVLKEYGTEDGEGKVIVFKSVIIDFDYYFCKFYLFIFITLYFNSNPSNYKNKIKKSVIFCISHIFIEV